MVREKGIFMTNRTYLTGKKRGQGVTTQLLLDGLVIYGQELGDLGKQLERLLRQRGVESSMDPKFSVHYCH